MLGDCLALTSDLLALFTPKAERRYLKQISIPPLVEEMKGCPSASACLDVLMVNARKIVTTVIVISCTVKMLQMTTSASLLQ